MKTMLLLLFTAASVSLAAQTDEAVRSKHFNVKAGSAAIQGYDPVAYFTAGKAIKGKSAVAARFKGITYYFSSEENRKAFLADPARYEPQYGGWCAYAMGSSGEKVEIDPDTFKILNGKLYLFYNKYFNNTLTIWNKNENALQQKADANWKKFVG